MTRLGDLPFWLVLGVVAVAAAAGVFLAVQSGLGTYWYAGLVPAVILTALYLFDSSPGAASSRSSSVDDDDFEDPVAEAVRLEAADTSPASGAETDPTSIPAEPGIVPDAADGGSTSS